MYDPRTQNLLGRTHVRGGRAANGVKPVADAIEERAISPFVLSIVLVAAALHAWWNLLAKRVGGGLGFVWLYFFLGVVLYAPVIGVAVAVLHPRLDLVDLGFIVGTGVLHLAYFVTLQRGYRVGDLSLVYPLARGTGPLLSSCAAIAFLGERPSSYALAGIVLILAGVFIAVDGHRLAGALSDRKSRLSIGYGIATGIGIAAYTLWDKHAVAALAISPIIYDYCANAVRTAILTPFILAERRRAEIAQAWREHRHEVLGIAVLSPLAYLLVLWALVTAPVSEVAPTRELSMLIGVFVGVRVLAEGRALPRVAAATLMLAGVIALARG